MHLEPTAFVLAGCPEYEMKRENVSGLGRSMTAVSRGAPNSEEGIRNLETSEALTVLQILRIEEIALRLDCG
jgi:hypothetical protein